MGWDWTPRKQRTRAEAAAYFASVSRDIERVLHWGSVSNAEYHGTYEAYRARRQADLR